MGIPEENRAMTRGEKIIVHIVFGIGVILFFIAYTIYLKEDTKKHNPDYVSVKTNNVKTNKPNPFVEGLQKGFKEGITGGLEK